MWKKSVLAAVVAGAIMIMATPMGANAMPSYARSGVPCFQCHSKASASENEKSVTKDKGLLSGLGAGVAVHTSAADTTWADGGKDLVVPMSLRVKTGGDKTASTPGDISGYLFGDKFQASLSMINPYYRNLGASSRDMDSLLFYRFAVTPKVIDGVDMAVGVFGASRNGDPYLTADDEIKGIKSDAMGLDAQARTKIGGVTLDLRAMYMNDDNGAVTSLRPEITTSRPIVDAYGAGAGVGIKSNTFGLSAAYRTYKGKTGQHDTVENIASIRAWVNLFDNTTLESQYTTFGAKHGIVNEDGAFSLLFITGF